MRGHAARNHLLFTFPDPHPPHCRHCPQTSAYLATFDYMLDRQLRHQQHGLCEAHAAIFAFCFGLVVPDAALEMERAA